MKDKPDLEKIKQDFISLLGKDYSVKGPWISTGHVYGLSVCDGETFGICKVLDYIDMPGSDGLVIKVAKSAPQEIIESAKKIAKKYKIKEAYMTSYKPSCAGIIKEPLKYKE